MIRNSECRDKLLLLFFVLFSCIYSAPAGAQKVKSVKGETTYYAASNETLEDAKRKALEQAKIRALAEEFGTLVSEGTESRGKVRNGQSEFDFFSIGSSEVKGEWIETTGEPEYDIRFEDGQIVVSCKVSGKAREIVTAAIDFKARILCNGTEDKFEGNRFKDGDDLFLSFASPVKGFLAVYLEDEAGQVNCLLPYRNQAIGIYPVDANRRYVFFDPKSAPANERALVDEYVMTCSHSSEYNQIYIIFSPNQFVKASDEDVEETLPRQLPLESFHKWLAKCRKHDLEMTVKKVGMTVEEKQ